MGPGVSQGGANQADSGQGGGSQAAPTSGGSVAGVAPASLEAPVLENTSRSEAPVLVLATHNPHKVTELAAILDSVAALGPLQLVAASDLGLEAPAEHGITFAANALAKARAVRDATGLPAAADDSGLCVAAMGGAPGVFSARWAGGHGDDKANLALLLDQLQDVEEPDRGAWFECAAALALPDGREFVETGRMMGRLARAPRGTGGFGYDPILIPAGQSLTSAELTPEHKNAISHRGQAFRALAGAIRTIWA